MKDIFKPISSIIFPRDQKSRTKLYVFLVCLGLSVFIWLIIKLSEEFVYELQFPVEISGTPEDRILVSGDDQYLTVRFEEKVSDLLYLRFFRERRTISLPAASLTTKSKAERTTGIIFPSLLKDYIERQLELEYTIVSLSPDSLKFVFETKKSKSVPVKSQYEVIPAKQKMLYGEIKLIPDSVIITGPISQVDSIDSLFLEKETFTSVSDSLNLERKISLSKHSDLVSVKPATISVQIPIEEYTEASTEVKISLKSSGPAQVKIIPETAVITYWIALSDYQKTSSSLFSVAADLDSAIKMGFKRAPLVLERSPEFIRNPRIEPGRIEYFIIKQ